MMRKFTYQQGSSSKFWDIELKGKSVTVTYGRTGGKGQTRTRTFADAAAARKEHDRLIQEKLGKGYVESTSTARSRPDDLRMALEQALVEAPDDIANHMAYADYLQEQGDPRGEFIQVQLALEDESKGAAERKRLRKREKELLEEHQRIWLGDLASYLLDGQGMVGYAAEQYGDGEANPVTALRFARGWLDSLHFKHLGFVPAWVLAWSPRVRLLRELWIEEGTYPGDLTEADDVAAPKVSETAPDAAPPRFPRSFGKLKLPPGEGIASFWPLARSPMLGNVRIFRVGQDQGEDYEAFNCGTYTVLPVDVARQMPRLEELYLWAKNYDLDALFQLPTLTNLRVLKVYHMNEPHRLDLLAGNPALKRLTHLLFHPHFYVHGALGEEIEPEAQQKNAYLNLEGVRALVRSPHLKSLTNLQLRLCSMGDAGCTEIVRSGILRRLKSLDLRHGCITDAGAKWLAECPDLRNLEYLDVERNALTKKGIALVRKVGIPTLRANDQLSEADAESGQYLYEGDFE